MDDFEPQARDAAPDGVGHEPSELGIRQIFLFGAALVVLGLVVHFALGLMMNGFSDREKNLATRRPELYRDQEGQFPAPNLQRNDAYDMAKLREEEDAAISSYGWVDSKAGVAHIPIRRALEILAERGLPKPKPPEKPETKAAAPGEPSR